LYCMRQPQAIVFLKKKSMTKQELVFLKFRKQRILSKGSPKWSQLQLTNPLRRQRKRSKTFKPLHTIKCLHRLSRSCQLTCHQLNPPRNKSLHWEFAIPDLDRKFSQRLE
jgi:hypothetical protein